MDENHQRVADSRTRHLESFPPAYTNLPPSQAHVTNDNLRTPLLSADLGQPRYTSQTAVITSQPQRVHESDHLSPEEIAAIGSEQCAAVCFACCVYCCCCCVCGILAFVIAMGISGDATQRRSGLRASRMASLCGLIMGSILIFISVVLVKTGILKINNPYE